MALRGFFTRGICGKFIIYSVYFNFLFYGCKILFYQYEILQISVLALFYGLLL